MTVTEPTTKKADTEYVILKHHKQEPPANQSSEVKFPRTFWTEVARVKAASADAAIRNQTESKVPADSAGTYVAIPARSWNPRTIKVETKQVVSLV